jgi:hypothetical protein
MIADLGERHRGGVEEDGRAEVGDDAVDACVLQQRQHALGLCEHARSELPQPRFLEEREQSRLRIGCGGRGGHHWREPSCRLDDGPKAQRLDEARGLASEHGRCDH